MTPISSLNLCLLVQWSLLTASEAELDEALFELCLCMAGKLDHWTRSRFCARSHVKCETFSPSVGLIHHHHVSGGRGPRLLSENLVSSALIMLIV